MFDKIAYLSVSGANFTESEMIPLFVYKKDPQKPEESKAVISLIYGRNGAGKSTIANAIKKLSGEYVSTSLDADFFDFEKNKIALTDKDQKSIYVYNEDFVNKYVHIDQDGLDSIVILEKKPELAQQIKDARVVLSHAEEKLTLCENKAKEYDDEKNEKSPAFYLNRMCSALKKKGGWAEQDGKLRGLKTNSNVSLTKYADFAHLKPNKSQSDLFVDYGKLMNEYEKVKKDSSKISNPVPSLSDEYTLFPITHGNQLLFKTTEEPVLSERDKHLLTLAKEDLDKRIEFLETDNKGFCPYCLQDLNSEQKSCLIERIEQTMENEVKQHQFELEKLIRDEWNVNNLSPFNELPSYKNAIESAKNLNELIGINNRLLQRKKEATHEKSECELRDLSNATKEFEAILCELETERVEHNKIIDDTTPIKDEINSIICQLAHYDIKDDYQLYIKSKNAEDKAKLDLKSAQTEFEQAKKALDDKLAEERGTKIAIDLINNWLKYIFYDDNRLSIVEEESNYVVYSRGKRVKPTNISVGERNVIGLCYYFVKILQEKENEDAYKNETLLVIDDPISSFDYQNKVGVLSFINFKLGQFVKGNADTRIIILTHDAQTMLDLDKVSGEYGKAKKLSELKAGKLYPFDKKQFEYTELISMVYKYANEEECQYQIVIGNVMRQVVEAFAQFLFKDNITTLIHDREVLDHSSMNNDQKEYFQSLMSRLVLHGGSHREEQAQSMDIEFLSAISEDEKRRTARDILCFIYLINQLHLKRQFDQKAWKDVEKRILSWCSSIGDSSDFSS